MPSIVARTYEWLGGPSLAQGEWRLVVTHEFHGDTLDEARAVMTAHADSDAFFRGCVTRGRFEDLVCWTTTEVRP